MKSKAHKKKAEAPVPRAKISTTKREESEIKALVARIEEEAPAPGSLETDAAEFADLPLSQYTMTGLNRGKFKTLTQIQRIAIPHALAG
jgi:superfamily II DNA/RNA helicase